MGIISNYDQLDNFLMCIMYWIQKQNLREIYRQITILFEFELPYPLSEISIKTTSPESQGKSFISFILLTFWSKIIHY